MRLLTRSSLRYLSLHPWQLGLAVTGIGLGVAVVISVDLMSESALRAFRLSSEALTGRATHQVIGGSGRLEEMVWRRLRLEAAIRHAAPVVEGQVALRAAAEVTLTLLGIDPLSESPIRPYLATGLKTQGGVRGGGSRTQSTGMLLGVQRGVMLSASRADALGLEVGDELELWAGGRGQRVHLIGLMLAGDPVSRQALSEVMVTDIATAQELLQMVGLLSRIDLILPEEIGAESEVLGRIRSVLPEGARLLRRQGRTEATEGMIEAFRLNLVALSLLALLCGMFLIYNTATFSVLQRQPLFGMLRALGVTRREILGLVVLEAALMGLLGTVAGLAGGIALGRGLVSLVAQTINDLYFSVNVQGVELSVGSLWKGLLLGVGATLVAALWPALEAIRTEPRATLQRSVLEARSRRRVPGLALAGVGMVMIAAVLMALPGRELLVAFIGLFVLVLGLALLVPATLQVAMWVVGSPARWLFGALGGMAARGITATLSRTAVAVSALMIAVSVIVSMGVMVNSFRSTVVRWLEYTLRSDVYLSTAVPGDTDLDVDLALLARLREIPGIARMETLRRVTLEDERGRTQLLVLDLDTDGYQGYRFTAGDPEIVWRSWMEGETVLVTEPYAFRHGISVGSLVELVTDHGLRSFEVAGVTRSYASDQGAVMISRTGYEAAWDDRGVSGIGFHLESDVDQVQFMAAVRNSFAAGAQVLVQLRSAMRTTSLEVFDRTFAITQVLQLFVVAVAFVGVLGALMALELERERELAVLRAGGVTRAQVWWLVTGQAWLIGLVSGLLALPVGTLLAWLMVSVINRRSFGWTLDMQMDPNILIEALLVSVVASVFAGVYPAWRMSRTLPAVALREE